jgi:hypothetical protein
MYVASCQQNSIFVGSESVILVWRKINLQQARTYVPARFCMSENSNLVMIAVWNSALRPLICSWEMILFAPLSLRPNKALREQTPERRRRRHLCENGCYVWMAHALDNKNQTRRLCALINSVSLPAVIFLPHSPFTFLTVRAPAEWNGDEY